jgi:hypothetical protein
MCVNLCDRIFSPAEPNAALSARTVRLDDVTAIYYRVRIFEAAGSLSGTPVSNGRFEHGIVNPQS